MTWRLWLLTLVVVALSCSAHAAPIKLPTPPPSWILIDASSGDVLEERDADTVYSWGALNQLMVLLLTLEQAELNMMPLTVPVTVSPKAIQPTLWAKRIPLRGDRAYVLSDLLKAIALSAADDVSIAAAEAIGGSIEGCVELMNARAARLGLTATHYVSIGGVRADNGDLTDDRTTARDLARLATVLARHPLMLSWSSLSGVPFDGGIVLRNANQLVGGVVGVDGMQVAVSHDAHGKVKGFEIVATAQRDALRLVAVVVGAADNPSRYTKAAELMEWGFANYDAVEVLTEGEKLALTVDVPNGSVKEIQPVVGGTVAFLRRHNAAVDVTYRLQLPGLLAAPVSRHQVIGEVVIERGARIVDVVPLLSPRDIKATSSFRVN